MKHLLLFVALLLAAGCATPPEWHRDVPNALTAARKTGREVIVYFALRGHDASDLMESQLTDPVILDALSRRDFDAIIADGVVLKRLYKEWIGGGEGMGVAVLDGNGYCYGARPGPQDPGQVAAFLDMCANRRTELAALRARLQDPDMSPLDQHKLGCLLLDLGSRVHSEPLLTSAAMAGVADAKHRLARLYALDGNVVAARRWLQAAPKTPPATLTEGYVLFKERRYPEAVKVLRAALATNRLGAERQHALLYLGKSLHQANDDEKAIPVLEKLAAEGTGSTWEAGARHTLNHIYNPELAGKH